MTAERLYIKERSQIPFNTLVGDFEGLSERVRTYAMQVKNPDKFRNHVLVTDGGWGEETYLSVEAERLETDWEMKRRIAKEERTKANHEKYLIEREALERAAYERLKEKYGDT